MLDTVRAVFSLLLSYGLLLLANGLFTTLLGVRSQIEEFATEIVGVIMASYFLGLLLGAQRAAHVVASVGHIRSFAAFASIMSVAALVHVLWLEPLVWCALRLASGFCMAGMVVVTESWLNERASNVTRGQVMALYMITNYFAAGCGQFLLPMADPGEFQLFSVASIVFSLALVPVLLTQAQAPVPRPPERLRFVELWRTSPLGLTGAFCAGMVNASFFGLGPVFAREIGLSIPETSAFMASAIFGGLLLQYPVGRLSDRVDRRTVLTGVAFATSLACLGLFVFARGAGNALIALAVLYGGLSFTVYSLCLAHTNDFAAPDKAVQTSAGLLTAFGTGAFAGPILSSSLMARGGPSTLFLFSATVLGLLGAFAIYRMRRRATKEAAERAPHINLPVGQFPSGQLQAALRDAMDRDLARMSGGGRRL